VLNYYEKIEFQNTILPLPIYMAVFFDIEHLPKFRNPVITVGTFDGVHKGHQALLQITVEQAQKYGGDSVLITFEPHPRKVLVPQQPLGLITSLREKIKLIIEAGIKHCVVVPFNTQFAHNTAIEYLRDFLVDRFHPVSMVIGHDHQFGHDRAGNINLLRQYASVYKYELISSAPLKINGITVSSTKIRNAIEVGDMESVKDMLGRHFTINGKVVLGNQLGRTIGYPTANIAIADKNLILPGRGVYAIRATRKQVQHNGMLSIGYNPTVSDTKDIKIEANLFDFSDDIYDEFLQVELIKKLRNEEKFPSVDALVQQLHADKAATLRVLGDTEQQFIQL
jgi:riboflavin kinase / FMN adenylyltransferase